MREFFHNPYVIETGIWLFMMGFLCLLADGPSKRVVSLKRVFACIIITLLIWGTSFAALIDAGKQMPPVARIKSPTIDSTCKYTVKP